MAIWLLPEFSTTLSDDRSRCCLMLLGTSVKSYHMHSYEATTGCGCPSVALYGDREDWVDLGGTVATIRHRLRRGGGSRVVCPPGKGS